MGKYNIKNFPLDDEIPNRQLTRTEEAKLRKTCVACLTTKTLTEFYSPKPGKYIGRCRECTNAYKREWQFNTSYQKGKERERLAKLRGFTSYDEYLREKNWAVGKPCPVCNNKLALKGAYEAVCLGRENLPNSYRDGFVCKKCTSTMRRLLKFPQLLDFIHIYDIPLKDTLPEDDPVKLAPRKMGRPPLNLNNNNKGDN